MELGVKALVSALVVVALMLAARHLGHRVAGWLAGAPTITGPALAWLAWQGGSGVLAEAALGSAAGCVACALFALVFSRVGGARRTVVALAASLFASALALPLMAQLRYAPWVLLPLSALACTWVVRWMPHPTATGRGGSSSMDIAVTALSAGAVSAAVALAQPQWGAFWAGVLASPPLVAAAIAVQRKLRGDPQGVRHFLVGYARGLVGRVAFVAALVVLVPYVGVPSALLAAVVAGILVMSRPGHAWTPSVGQPGLSPMSHASAEPRAQER